MKRIAVLTSGGDAPGMNAAIRAAVRTGLDQGWEVYGVRHGFAGLIAGELAPLSARDVGGIMQLAGTILRSARAPEFLQEAGRRQALAVLENHRIDALIVIGGSGSQAGAHALSQMGYPVVGVASTIDNDVYGTEMTIGVDTALNIALEAIDRLKATASALQRAFLVEVMGRDCGYLALMAGLAGGAEAVVLPEVESDPEALIDDLRAAYDRGKAHSIIVVAEGARYDAEWLSHYFAEHRDRIGFTVRATILGHVQRGGVPTAFDRLLATRLAAAAVTELAAGRKGVLMGLRRGEVAAIPLADVASKQKTLDPKLLELVKILAR
ncbi:MAG: ATP-dependent 6-phosphofructokinase [Armatimonadota bacterium]|nr:ATP-dependent 6-phosphofructokinase [Armatimonadota bacterium]